MVETIVEVAAAGLAAWAAWLTVPRPPSLDWQRLFKTTLSTVLYGEVLASTGERADWEAAVAALVPYHPAARDEAARLSAPDPDAVPAPALPGERALVEALAALPDPTSRYRRMFADSEQTRDALLCDPADLGAAFDPVAAIGVGVTWEAIAAWEEPVRAALARKFGHVVVVGVETDLAGVMAAQIGGRGMRLEEDGLIPALEEALAVASDRVVFIGEGAGIPVILRAMHGHPGLRDRVAAVISIGGDVAVSAEQKAWMAECFTQEAMDTELNRSTPYVGVVVVNPDAPLEADWAGQRWPDPEPGKLQRRPVMPVDLGAVPGAWLEGERAEGLARGLWVVVGFL